MYFGRVENGQEVRLHVQCRDNSDIQVDPDNCPILEIWSQGAKKVYNVMMFPEDSNVPGFFTLPWYLQGFSAGTCQVVMRWKKGSFYGVAIGYFEVIPGGHDEGAVIAMTYFDTPQGRFMVHQTDAGITKMGKNPQ